MRASIDWPHWATSTRSSMTPRRNGPKIFSHGCGREPMPARNVAGTDVQESGHDIVSAATSGVEREQFRVQPAQPVDGTGVSGACRPFAEYLLSVPALACHDIRQHGYCQRV